MSGIKVLSVASELYPLVKTGGLGDVTGALPLALRDHDVETVTLMPGYPDVLEALNDARRIFTAADLFGGYAHVLAGRAAGLDLLVIDAPHLYDRPDNPYLGPDGLDWPDNAFRFGALGWIASRIGLGDVPGFAPDIIHCHDWQAGLTPAYLAYDGRRHPATVMTVHNLAYQGKFPAPLLADLRLPRDAFRIDGVEYYGMIGFLKAGLQFADRITTVSPTFAVEMQTPDNGFGLDGLLRARASVVSGIINGIDINVWDPLRDARIPSPFGRTTLSARSKNTAHLRQRFAWADTPERPLIGIVSRFTWQKGLDIVAESVPAILKSGAQLAILGTGDAKLESLLGSLAVEHPDRIGCIIDYDEDMAHLMQAGADVLLVPSRFEPCGLTQLCALRYGALPLVTKVGGLADTVVDLDDASDNSKATGFQFSPVTKDAFETALRRVSKLWPDKETWRRLQLNGMDTDVSWKKSASAYARLYAETLAAKN